MQAFSLNLSSTSKETGEISLGLNGASIELGPSSIDSGFARCCIPWSLVVVDVSRKILDTNKWARDLLDDQEDIRNSSGILKIRRSGIDRTIAQLVLQTISLGTGLKDTGHVVGIPDDCGRTRFALRVLPCYYLGDSAALIVITDMLSETHAAKDMLAKLFSLSAREAQFAERFASGFRVERIAAEMAISSSTARIHLRHLFSKTGCKTQAGLARLFARALHWPELEATDEH